MDVWTEERVRVVRVVLIAIIVEICCPDGCCTW
jgi:hypothetical protein